MKKLAPPPVALSNAEIAHQLKSLAQLLTAQGENPFKVKAYRRAADTVASLSESVAEQVRRSGDLTEYPGIGAAISSAIREIVLTGSLGKLTTLRAKVSPEIAALNEHPRLDPKRVLRAYQKLQISSVAELKEKLANGEVAEKLGARMDQHLRHGLIDAHEVLWCDAEPMVDAVEKFLRDKCGVRHVAVAGAYRRRVEVIGEMTFLIETDDFAAVVDALKGYGGRTELVSGAEQRATFKLPVGILLTIETVAAKKWGLGLIIATGSDAHLEGLAPYGITKLAKSPEACSTEPVAYRKLGLRFIEPELREGRDEVERASKGTLPHLVTLTDIRGELHAHSTSSDGANTIADMAKGARERSYEYVGITDHSQSLKIAGGVSEDDLWQQIRAIDRLNAKLKSIRVLKSAEVDILADGALDYPNELLKELDYTVCSIHSRFGLGKAAQTERIMRAMDNPYFSILGHATGRLLLRRPGYEIDIERVVEHARENGCYFEINSSPDRLDLSVAHTRLAHAAGVKIAVCTDAHSVTEFDFIRYGVDQARRAGLEKTDILNCLGLAQLQRALRR